MKCNLQPASKLVAIMVNLSFLSLRHVKICFSVSLMQRATRTRQKGVAVTGMVHFLHFTEMQKSKDK
jgi:hypothetical protein